jgi:protein-S-isoprenylcysteine O-methyltransferase Ste14
MKRMFKLLFFLLIGPGSVIFYIPYFLLFYSGPPDLITAENLQFIGILPILAGFLVSLKCFFDFIFTGQGTPVPIDPPKKLVVSGLYRLSRNPMYIGILIILFGEAILFRSLILIGYTVIVFCLFQIFIVGFEEPFLNEKFGKKYNDYCNVVPRWIAHLKKTNSFH